MKTEIKCHFSPDTRLPIDSIPNDGIVGGKPVSYSQVMGPDQGAKRNRRCGMRIEVRLACHVLWPHNTGHSAIYTGNISRHGMLLEWDPVNLPAPFVNDPLILEVALPELTGFESRCIRCQASIARIDHSPETGALKLGLRVLAMDFQTLHPAIPQPVSFGSDGHDIEPPAPGFRNLRWVPFIDLDR